MDFFFADTFYNPKTIDLGRLDEEIEAGNENAALLKAFLHLGRFGCDVPFGYEEALECLTSFVKNHPEHRSNPLIVVSSAALDYYKGGGSEPEARRKLDRIITPAVAKAVIKRTEQGSHLAHYCGAMLVGRGFGTKLDFARARDLLEKVPDLSIADEEEAANPGEKDALLLFELAITYESLARYETIKRYTDDEKREFLRKSSLLRLAAANLEDIFAQQTTADLYRQQPDDCPFFPEITDRAFRLERAEYYYRAAIAQGADSSKIGLAHVLAETDRADEAKALLLACIGSGDIKAKLALAEVHDQLGEYQDAFSLFAQLIHSTESREVRTKVFSWLLEYTSEDGKPGVVRSDQDHLRSIEALLRVHAKNQGRLTDTQKRDLEAKGKVLWARAWFNDQEKGLRRARRGIVPVRPAPLARAAQRAEKERFNLVVDRYNLQMKVYERSADDILDEAKAKAFVILPADQALSLAYLLAEARKPLAKISADLAAELIQQAQIWVRDAKRGLYPARQPIDIIQNPKDFVVVPEDQEEALPFYIKAADEGSESAAEMALALYREKNELDRVWVRDYDGGYLRPFVAGDHGGHVVFVPLDPEQATEFLAARRTETELREAAAALAAEEERRAADLRRQAEAEQEALALAEQAEEERRVAADLAAQAEAERAAAEDSTAILAYHAAAAEGGSAPDALLAGALYYQAGDHERSDAMYALAVDHGGFQIGLEVAVRYAGLTEKAPKNMEFALGLYDGLYQNRDQLPSDDQERLTSLHQAILEDAWIVNSRQLLQRVQHGVWKTIQVRADEKLYLFPPDEESLQLLEAHRRTSFDAAAEYALRLGKGSGGPANLTEAFRQLSDLLLDRKHIPPREKDPIGMVPLASEKREELQREWDREALFVEETGEDENGDMEYVMRGAVPGTAPWIIPAASVRLYRSLLTEGRARARKAMTAG